MLRPMEANTENQAMQLAWLTPFGLFRCCLHASLLRTGRSQHVVYSRVCGVMRTRIDLRLSAGRRLAVWARGGHLGASVTASLAYQTCFKRISHAAKWRCRHPSFQMTFLFPNGVCGESTFFHCVSDGGA